MESLDLTYKLIALKIKSKTLDQIYFMSQVFQEHSHCYDKRKKIRKLKLQKFIIFAATPSLSGRGLLQPHPPTFFVAKIFENFFHRYMRIWTKGRQMDRMAILAKTQKRHEGKSERQPPPLLHLRKRIK